MKKKAACLIYSNSKHYLDHLAPLAYFLKIPIISNVEDIILLSKKYYPKVKAIHIDDININFFIVQNFDNLIMCTPKIYFDSEFRFHQDVLHKEIKIIWCPHGNSDKGKTIYFFEGLKNEKNILVYGQKMIGLLKEKKVFHTIETHLVIGNYRYKYFKKFKVFHKKLIEDEIKKYLPKNNLNILYSPTWEDKENSSSFPNIDKLLSTLPSQYNLIVKLHPNIIKKNEIKIDLLMEKYKKTNVLFINKFPLIYPILDFIDILIADFSSIGYDFLTFEKPMFILKPINKKLYSDLFEIATLTDADHIYETIENPPKNIMQKDKRKNLYDFTFSEPSNFNKLKNMVFS